MIKAVRLPHFKGKFYLVTIKFFSKIFHKFVKLRGIGYVTVTLPNHITNNVTENITNSYRKNKK
jgi:hypothetical protein